MSEAAPRLEIATAPFLHRELSTRRLMWEVLASLAVVVAAAGHYFGVTALLVVAASSIGACGTEWLLARKRGGLTTLPDGSAFLTGVLLALTLPPSIPLWMAFLGGVASIVLGKAIWGGLGMNVFNPALVGRAFLQASFPSTLTTWSAPGGDFLRVRPESLAVPLGRPAVDATTTATPLGLAKFDGEVTGLGSLLAGDTAGSLGETAGLLLLVCGLWLALRRVFDWRLPASTLLAVAIGSGVLHAVNPDAYPGPLFMLLSGGLMFGAVFMVTDPVTTPLTPRGAWIFGAGVGVLVVLIRLFGGLPEGVMYAILLMNSATPLINRFTQPRRFGG